MTKFNANCEYSNIGEHLTTKKTPAVTIVAACISAETGVYSPLHQVAKYEETPDFPIPPINKKIQIKVIKLTLIPKILIFLCLVVLPIENLIKINSSKKKKY